MKLTQNQYYGLLEDIPHTLSAGSVYLSQDTRQFFIYGEDGLAAEISASGGGGISQQDLDDAISSLILGTPITVVSSYSLLPSPNSVPNKFYYVDNSEGTKWLPGSLGGTFYPKGLYHSTGASWTYLESPYQGTQIEVNEGVNNEKFVTPLTLENYSKWNTKYDSSNPAGYINSVPAQSFPSITNKPTTISGYGILDAYPLSGNPSGFLTSYSESDPVVRAVNGIVKSNGTIISAAVAGTDYVIPSGTVSLASNLVGLTTPVATLNNQSGINTGDQVSIVGITGTKSQFDTAITDGNIQFVGDAPTAHTHTLLNGATDVTITAANLNTLDDNSNSNLHFHDSDRSRSNHTGTQVASTISNFITEARSSVVDNSISDAIIDKAPSQNAVFDALSIKTENSSGSLGGFLLTDNGNGTVNINSGEVLLRNANTSSAQLSKYSISAVVNLPLTDNDNNYILADYNSGSPTLTVVTDSNLINTTTNTLLYLVVRVGNELNHLYAGEQNVDSNGKLRRRFLNTEAFSRATGAVISNSNRNLLLTQGLFYSGLSPYVTPAFDTSTIGTFTLVYSNGSVWTRVPGQTQISNTQYNSLGALTNLSNNKFRVDYIYVLINNPSKLYVVLGDIEYLNISNARLSTIPITLPVELQRIGVLVGRLIIEKDSATINEIASNFDLRFTTSSVSNHNDLGGLNLGDYKHLTILEKAKFDAISGTNTGDQTSIIGITGTKSQFNSAVSDGDIQFVGDAPTSHNHTLLSGATDVTITATNLNILDDGLDTTLHFHASDRARSAHTGTQLASTISDFNTAVDDRVAAGITGKQNALTLTTTGSSGAATLIGSTLNIPNYAGGGAGTNLTWTPSATTGTMFSDTGTDAVISLGNGTLSGLSINDYTTAEKTKLAGIAANATVNSTDTVLLARANHTGTQGVATITGLGTLATQSGTFSGTSSGTNSGDQTSIAGISGTKAQFNAAVSDGDIVFVGDAPTIHTHTLLAGATDVTITAANLNILDDGIDTNLHFHTADRARGVHTGTQLASTISDFNTSADARVAAGITGKQNTISLTTTGSSGAATLIGSTLNIPNYVGGGGGGGTLISATVILDFGIENDYVTQNIPDLLVTNSNIKSISFLNIETSETSLDDFSLNGVSFAIENIIDNISFNIRGNALNNASGNYTVKYLIQI